MAEENQVQHEPQQVMKEPMKEPQRVTTKDPNKVEAGKRLAAINHKKREVKKREVKKREEVEKTGEVSQYYGIGAVIAVGVIGGLGYYIYRTKKGQTTAERGRESPPPPPQQPHPKTNKFEMD